ncbi:MAG: TonB-dependent receptor plug domain-containing protein, partial [Gammaproteobacteria bacterium]
MHLPISRLILAGLIPLICICESARADTQNQTDTTALGSVEVTATPLPENLDSVPQSITIINHDQLATLGATDLRSALALVAGVDIAPGGDSGPAGAIPEFQGLREFDAFLLLVDGVPVGG